ncbi:TetR/AcrR family transcriptional regulator [Aeromicrobium duanguangcaii]|uniref:TetR family transcriptional regulator n=1 Tax=Aeromicrobium duanguangcaii TaxID=2968086 RepID=A0ABY5KEV6_9ACTN|nr:TetR/AcrR family transcriptional regulator [Aeromicrobium duanguangcaii]MCD9154609.1 TetR family transcriptional regulator [Aeromicrobium duanguangcaii]MCL3838727.1 TetR family transcriptional regulator [Aeromicrobium duanguangcaii]UUI67976.1 TetR family transcriptional regulator [Aeromicrobium duanguangcaii]
MTTQILEPRKRPTQERSKVKFDHLLQVSRDLLLETGFESFTCEEVAQRAGLPIGTLYQFFANKYVIVCELDRQNAVAIASELDKLASELPTLDWLVLLDRLVDHMSQLWINDPSRSAVWYAVQSTPVTRATAEITERELAARVAHVLAPLTPGTPRDRRKIMAEVLVHMAYSMLNFSVRDLQEHDEAITELKRLLASYLLAAEAGAT